MLFMETIDLGERSLIWTLQTLCLEMNGISCQPHLTKGEEPDKRFLVLFHEAGMERKPHPPLQMSEGTSGTPRGRTPAGERREGPKRPSRESHTYTGTRQNSPTPIAMGKARKASEGTKDTSPNSQRPPLRSFSGRGPDLPSPARKEGRQTGREPRWQLRKEEPARGGSALRKPSRAAGEAQLGKPGGG